MKTVGLILTLVVFTTLATAGIVLHRKQVSRQQQQISSLEKAIAKQRSREIGVLDEMCSAVASAVGEEGAHLDHKDVTWGSISRMRALGVALIDCIPKEAYADYERYIDSAAILESDPWRPNGAWTELAAAVRVADQYYRVSMAADWKKVRHPPLREDPNFFDTLREY